MSGKNLSTVEQANLNASAIGSAVPALDRRERNLRKRHMIPGGPLAAETVPE